MLSSHQILEFVTQDAAGLAGKIEAAGRFYAGTKEANGPGRRFTHAEEELVDDLKARQRSTREGYVHPGHNSLAYRPSGPLQPADLVWIQRLPADPTEVSFEDARQLASMERAVPRTEHPSDARLIEAVWAPIREYHDAQQAAADLRDAQRTLPPAPASTLRALAEAIAHEIPALSPAEAFGRAQAALQEALEAREAEQQQAIAKARAAVEAAAAEAASRRAVHRPFAGKR